MEGILILRPGLPGSMIRNMALTDWPKIRRFLAETPSAAQWITPPEAIILAAEEQGELIGMIAIRAVFGEAEILNIAVAAPFRRRGWGRKLLDAALAEVRAAGVRRVFLEVRESNGPAREFYGGLHFEEAYRRQDYYRDPQEDALVLIRNIE